MRGRRIALSPPRRLLTDLSHLSRGCPRATLLTRIPSGTVAALSLSTAVPHGSADHRRGRVAIGNVGVNAVLGFASLLATGWAGPSHDECGVEPLNRSLPGEAFPLPSSAASTGLD